MPVEGQFNPNESVRKVRQLITRGDIWTQEVILVITNTDIIIRDGSTRVRASSYISSIKWADTSDYTFISKMMYTQSLIS